MITQIYNGKVLSHDRRWLKDAAVIIADGKILEVNEHGRFLNNIDRIDAKGAYILPGGIDLHVHGGGGRDFMEGTSDAFEQIIDVHQKHGTTSLYATLASSTNEQMKKAAETCERVMKTNASLLGLHFEGPYFDVAMAGGQIAGNVRKPNHDEYKSLVEEFNCIRRWDAAPELEGAMEFGKFISAKGILVGLAHTKADYPIVKKAFHNGFSFATHFYNAMTAIHKDGIYKKAGTVEAVYLIDEINVEVIADGVHVPPEIISLVHKFKGFERTCLVTDALAITENHEYASFDERVMIDNGVCRLKDGSALAGSCATMDRLIRTAVKEAGIPLEDVIGMVSETPARIMDVFEHKGSLAAGKDADIIIMDENLDLVKVLAMGKEIVI